MTEVKRTKIPAGPTVVLFTGDKCPPCEALKPLLGDEMTRRPGVNYLIVKPDEASMHLYRHYSVRSSPTVLYLKDGAELGRFTGMRPPEVIRESLNRWNVR